MKHVGKRGAIMEELRWLLAAHWVDGVRPIDLAHLLMHYYPGAPRSQVGMRIGQLLAKMYRRGQVIRGPHHLAADGRVLGTRYYPLPVDTTKLEA